MEENSYDKQLIEAINNCTKELANLNKLIDQQNQILARQNETLRLQDVHLNAIACKPSFR